MLLTLPLAAAECSSSFKNGITDLHLLKILKPKSVSKVTLSLADKEVAGKQISTASFSPVSLDGLGDDVACNAKDTKAYVFKMKMNVGDAAQFIVYTDTGDNMGSWQIRWCVRAKKAVLFCL